MNSRRWINIVHVQWQVNYYCRTGKESRDTNLVCWRRSRWWCTGWPNALSYVSCFPLRLSLFFLSVFVFLRSCVCLSLSVMSFSLYFSVRGFSPLLRVCVPLTSVLFSGFPCLCVFVFHPLSYFARLCLLLPWSSSVLFVFLGLFSFRSLPCCVRSHCSPPPPPLLFFLWLFIKPENVDNNRGMASVGGTIWGRDVTMIDGGFPVESEGWRRRWIVKRRRFQLKRLFPIGSLNVWHLTIGSLIKETLFCF